MSTKQEEKAIPVSLWDDARLRPWTIDDELDRKIDEENNKLQEMIQQTSGSKIAGMQKYVHFDNEGIRDASFVQLLTHLILLLHYRWYRHVRS